MASSIPNLVQFSPLTSKNESYTTVNFDGLCCIIKGDLSKDQRSRIAEVYNKHLVDDTRIAEKYNRYTFKNLCHPNADQFIKILNEAQGKKS